MKRLKISILTALCWAVSFLTPYSVAGNNFTKEELKSSLLLNENLLSKSSLVRNVQSVNLPQASQTLEQARSFHAIALEKLSSGDLEGATKARGESLRLLMLASKLANQALGFVEEKAKSDYEKKLKSIQGLLDAHKRITGQNSDTVTEASLQEKVVPLMNASKKSMARQDFKEGLASLTKVYFMVATSIKTQRSGQTLIRSLDFATEKEAYEYELGRYENYQMLVNMMIDERRAFKRDARTKPFFDEAASYHAQAESLVVKGQYNQAAELIEKASKSLVNLLRDSGVHIPGV